MILGNLKAARFRYGAYSLRFTLMSLWDITGTRPWLKCGYRQSLKEKDKKITLTFQSSGGRRPFCVSLQGSEHFHHQIH